VADTTRATPGPLYYPYCGLPHDAFTRCDDELEAQRDEDAAASAPEPRYRVPCEFCGTETRLAPSELLEERSVCEDCRKAVKWCASCEGKGCDACGSQGTDPSAGCQKRGRAFCEIEEGYCEACALRLAERKNEEAEQRGEHYREMGWAR
jgi:hypothetical protein